MKTKKTANLHFFRSFSLLLITLVSIHFNVQANAARPAQTPYEEWLLAYQRMLSPNAMSPATGSIYYPSPHGPFRTTTKERMPEKALEPFNQKTVSCPGSECQFIPNVVLIKLREPSEARESLGNVSEATSQSVASQLTQVLENFSVKTVEPVFQDKQHSSRRIIQKAQGEWVQAPNLGLWHRVEFDPEKDANADQWSLSSSHDAEKSPVSNIDVHAAMEALRQQPNVEYVEPEYIYQVNGEPSAPSFYADPDVDRQWHLDAAGIPEAWAILDDQGKSPGGDPTIVVAVIDTGVDFDHPDLVNSMWVNPGEFGTDSNEDSDTNGYVDDIHGARVISGAISGDPMDDHGHGTHVAGIIAAQGNNGRGGVGVAPNVKIMAIKAAQYSGILSATDVARGIEYAMDNGADIINMSFGGYARSQLMEDALANAFGTAVLVAAAGNDGRPNQSCPIPGAANFYPAAFNWVLGVMATERNPSLKNEMLASFSNFDCIEKDPSEYEIMAPGVQIFSTLPNNGYGTWSGTSMSSPIISGIAALARTKWSDKSRFSSRFIMGQVAATGNRLLAQVNSKVGEINLRMADATGTLQTFPSPAIDYLEHWIFDAATLSEANIENGRLDSGETVDLAIVVKNHWGRADNVSITLEPFSPGSSSPSPYITMITDTVDYGSVGSYSTDDNGLLTDDSELVIGVENPFRFHIAQETPNNFQIILQATITGTNGLSGTAEAISSKSYLSLRVQRGRELQPIVTSDLNLSPDHFWIIPGPVLVPSDVTITVSPGTQIQWGGQDGSSAYADNRDPYLQVEGNLIITGTPESPVELFPQPFTDYTVAIHSPGVTTLSNCQILDPELGSVASVDHDISSRINQIDRCHMTTSWSAWREAVGIRAESISNSWIQLTGWIGSAGVAGRMGVINGIAKFQPHSVKQSQVDLGFMSMAVGERNIYSSRSSKIYEIKNSVIQPSNPLNPYGYNWGYEYGAVGFDIDPYLAAANEEEASQWQRIENNAFLNRNYEMSLDRLSLYMADIPRDTYFGVANNYWGTASEALIDAFVYDYTDRFDLGVLSYKPFLTEPSSETYPFVTDITVFVEGVSLDEVGAETVDITVAFNRDMDQSIDPMVSFGPAAPYSDYIVSGAWENARQWSGSFNIDPLTGDGYQYFRVKNAVAASDPWLIADEDHQRFRFEIITSGTESMNLQASGEEGQVQLWWTQTDFETLAGYNVYRAVAGSSNFQRINSSLIPQGLSNWIDTDIVPGVTYHYYFTVVKTNLSESEPSNVAQATPLDTIAPVISHIPISAAAPGQSQTFRAEVTDNVVVKSVKLFYRMIGSETWQSQNMAVISGRYSVTLTGSEMSAPGLEYYIEASDGVNVTRSILPATPHTITIENIAVVTAISPSSGPASGGTDVTISGSNFSSEAQVQIGQSPCSSVIFRDTTSLQCTTNRHIPELADVKVTNPSAEAGVLRNAFQYLSETATLSLPTILAARGQTIAVPISLANAQSLVSADFTISYDPAVVTLSGHSLGNLTNGWIQSVNTSQSGEVIVSMASSGGSISGSGTLLSLRFDVDGAAGESTVLAFKNVGLNDGSIPVELGTGEIQIEALYQIGGQIKYWSSAGSVDSVTIDHSAPQSPYSQVIGESGANGQYSVYLEPGSHELTPERAVVEGSISALDASLILRHSTGELPLSGHALTAGDVNRSGSANAHDAFLVLQHVVGLSRLPFSGAGQKWLFSPAYRSYSNLSHSQSNQDFTAILLGDPSGNWIQSEPEGGTASFTRTSQSTFHLSSGWAEPGENVETVFSMTPEKPFFALQFELEFDPVVVESINVTPHASITGWTVVTNAEEDGRLRIAAAGNTAVSSATDLLTVTFNITGKRYASSKIIVSDLLIDETPLASGVIPASINVGDPRYIFRDDFIPE